MRKLRVLVVAVFFLLLMAPLLYAGNSACVQVRGLAQEHLLDMSGDPIYAGRPGDGWTGPVFLVLGQNDLLMGKISEYDGDSSAPPNGVGQGKGGSYLFDFGVHGTFLVRYSNAVWPILPNVAGAGVSGTFHASGSLDVTAGTGRFANATGNLTSNGPFMAWNVEPTAPTTAFGWFNNSFNGTLCNVGPINIAPPRPSRKALPIPSAANATSQGCRAFHVAEFFDGMMGWVGATMGGKAIDFDGIEGVTLNIGEPAGNMVFGTETLRFHFPNGSTFDLNARFEVIGDPGSMAQVNGIGDIANGTGDFQGATGRLNYHGPFAEDANLNFTFLDVNYRGHICTAR